MYGFSTLVVCGAMATLLGVILAIAGIVGWVSLRRFTEYGVKCKGEVTHIGSRYVKNRGRVYYADVAYAVDGVEYNREVTILPSDADALTPGDSLDILYNRRRPKRVVKEVPRETEVRNIKIVIYLAAACLVAGASMLMVYGMRCRPPATQFIAGRTP